MKLSLTSKYRYGSSADGRPTVTVKEDSDHALLRNAVVAAVHWGFHRKEGAVPSVRVAVPSSTPARVLDALVTLAGSVHGFRVEVVTCEPSGAGHGQTPLRRDRPDFANDLRVQSWAEALERRQDATLPPIGVDLASALASTASFRWYRNVTGSYWSGRVAGWEVARLRDKGGSVTFGETQADREAGECFRQENLPELVRRIEAFAQDRRNTRHRRGQHKQEHLLESAMWRGPSVVEVQVPGYPEPLQPLVSAAEPPLQVPALFSPDCTCRFMDAVMRAGSTAWVVELKVATSGQGKAYLDAITQAVLYREFLRTATPVAIWLRERLGMQPEEELRVEAAVAFPRLRARSRSEALNRLQALRETARVFGVEVVELDEWDSLRSRGTR